ncbi:MAG: hypothetical protein ACLVML_01120 [Candidatus Gastranaerophilaceae bacterium]|nr:hypothetical protein [Christensenellales bacterium]
MHGKLCIEIGERVETALILAVTALRLAVVIGADKFVPNAEISHSRI